MKQDLWGGPTGDAAVLLAVLRHAVDGVWDPAGRAAADLAVDRQFVEDSLFRLRQLGHFEWEDASDGFKATQITAVTKKGLRYAKVWPSVETASSAVLADLELKAESDSRLKSWLSSASKVTVEAVIGAAITAVINQ